MPYLVTDGGRQIIVDSTTGSTPLPIIIGPPCNFKVVDAWWQEAPAGTAGTPGLVFQDSKGRVFRYTFPTDLTPVNIGRLDWVEGPITITTLVGGLVYFVLGNK